jgi:hypothetical protein
VQKTNGYPGCIFSLTGQLWSIPKTVYLRREAAIVIQKYFRGYVVRQAHLANSSYSFYTKEIAKLNNPNFVMSKAETGKTDVYFPLGLPKIVLKKSGREKAITRFSQMQFVRTILRSQGSFCLTIPKAALCGEFLVEERLPILVDQVCNMGIYVSEPHLFTQVVLEITRLFSKVHLDGLVSPQKHGLNSIVGDCIRYDNFPLYIEEKEGKREGKVGLIDLEHIEDRPNIRDFSGGLATIARIFPYHIECVIQEAIALDIPINPISLRKRAEEGRKFLEEGYIVHRDWLRKKGISRENVEELFVLGKERVNLMIQSIGEELLKLNRGENEILPKKYENYPPFLGGFLSEDLEKGIRTLSEHLLPIFIRRIENQIRQEQSDFLRSLNRGAVLEHEMVASRSLSFDRKEIYKEIAEILRCIAKNDSDEFYQDMREVADQLLYVFLDQLVKGGEIFSFDHGFHSGESEFGWIRF